MDPRSRTEFVETGARGGLSVAELLARARGAGAAKPAAGAESVADAASPATVDTGTGQLARADPRGPGDPATTESVPEAPADAEPVAADRSPAIPEPAVGSAAPGERDVDRLAAAMTAIANRFLADPIDADTDFFDGGGKSVDAVGLVAAIARELEVELSLDDVFADARPRRLAKGWLTTYGVDAAAGRPAAASATTRGDEDLRRIVADIAGADNLPWVGAPEKVAPRRILLTGATGFLGSHVLLDLLRHSDAHVACLVRADDDAAAVQRLGAALASFQLPWSAEVRRRVTVLAGDIRKPRLGLSEENWNTLAEEADAIVNVAAAVDFLRGYSSLRQSNVLGPLTLAELAATGRSKPLHHISSVAVFNELGIESMGEDDPVAHIDKLVAGYDQSKWAAEAALRRAREHGVVVTFLRPGGIGGNTHTGAHNPRDLSTAFSGAFTRFRTAPAFTYLNAAPVDWVSRITAAVVCDPDAWGYNYHLTGVPSTLDDVVSQMSLAGMGLRVQPWEQWRSETVQRIKSEPVPELAFLARVLESPTARQLCEASVNVPAATCERTRAFVARHGLPPVQRHDARAQQATIERLAATGVAVLPSPADSPHLWFPETLEGTVGDDRCTMSLTLSIASNYQIMNERRVDVGGEIICPAIHSEPLIVVSGDMWVRPQAGIPRQHGLRHPLLRYRLRLRDVDGKFWWLEGQKTARPRRDWWRQTRALAVEIGRDGEPTLASGEVVVPSHSYVPDQVDGLRTNPELTDREQRTAKLVWFGWLYSQMSLGLAEPALRALAELLDLLPGKRMKELDR
ncbi:thioester reductase domain-containing protein [Nocardia cyriacigeorgica]|uniref:thioester reductase domain-containing protein n=1 Tax=Nocardia cyriacigeorgica TaxID=135487 RepID=UPI0024574350|nr:thioester reductase domain-containing protein [Nocardia cyriacigeorgica]